MTPRTVCIAGKNQIAVDAVLFLIERGWRDRLLVCANRTDDGVSRWQPSLLRFAREYGIREVSLSEAEQEEGLVFVSLEFDRIIRPSKFRDARLYNIHFSRLPAYKGMYTSALPILHGCTSGGVTLHEIDHGIDTGPIVDTRTFLIRDDWTSRDLYFECLSRGSELFRSRFDELIAEVPPAAARQSPVGSSYYSKSALDYSCLSVDLNDTAQGVVNQLRAYSFREYQIPRIDGLEVGSWEVLGQRSTGKPGVVVSGGADYRVITTVDFDLLIRRFQHWDWHAPGLLWNTRSLPNAEYIDIPNENGWTPLMTAAYSGSVDLCSLLLVNGANPNLANKNGTTPLMYAVSAAVAGRGSGAARLLIDHGADASQKDCFGKSIQEYHAGWILGGDISDG